MRMRRRSPRYRDELKRNRHKNIVMWLVAPQIPTSVREFLDDKGIEYSEFHFGQFRRVAERHSFIIKSEAESSSQSGPSKVPENKNQSRQPRGLCSSQQGISLVPEGPLVTFWFRFALECERTGFAVTECRRLGLCEVRLVARRLLSCSEQ